MALQKQVISFSLGSGVDTKTDPKQVSGKLSRLENGVFVSPKEVRKRFGYQGLSQATFNGAPIQQGSGLATFKDELLSFDGSTVYSYAPASGRWGAKGTLVNLAVSSSPVVRNTNRQVTQDSAYHLSGLQVFTWEESNGSVRYSLLDSQTQQGIVESGLVSSTAARPKPIVIGNYFVIFYVNTSTSRLQFRAISIGSPTTLAAAVDANVNLNATNFLYDVCVSQGSIYFAYNNNTGSISVRAIDAFLDLSSVYTVGSDAASSAINATSDAAGNIWISYCNGTSVKSLVINATLSAVVLAAQLVETAVARNITGIVSGTSASLFYEIAGADEYKNQVRTNTLTLTGTVGTPSTLARSVGLASKAFAANADVYLLTAYGPSPTSTTTASLQSTYFLLNSKGVVVGKVANQLAGGVTVASILPEVNLIAAGVFQTAVLQKDALTTVAGNVFTNTGVMSAQLDFANGRFQAIELASNLHITGGLLSMYDGTTVAEHGFNVFPERVSVSTSTSGGSIAAGSYEYAVVYRWTDAQGQDHFSAPSVGVTVVTSGSSSSNTLTIPTLRLTGKQNVQVSVYRTLANQTTFYAVTTPSSPLLNSTTSDSVTFTDTLADASIVGSEQLYTTGGVIENIAAPATQILGTFKNRLIVIPSENSKTWWFSRQSVPGAPVSLNDTFVKNIDQRGGAITACAQLDSNLIFFKESSMFYTGGEGPSANGQADDFTDALLISADSGCVGVKSLVAVPAGLMYQSKKGIYLLSRSLVDSYIGADVEGFNASQVTSAQLLPTVNQARFTLSTGVSLVFDYLAGQWSVFTNIAATDSAIWQHAFTYIRSGGRVLQEQAGLFTDDGQFIKLKIVSGPISFVGIQGYQRVYRAMLLGEYKSAHRLLVQVAYDYSPVFIQQDYIDAGSLIGNPTTYGSGGNYGAGTYGGTDPTYQFRVDFAQQKCESIQLSIEDVQGSNYGEGYSLSAISFEVGAKAGLNRLPATRIFG